MGAGPKHLVGIAIAIQIGIGIKVSFANGPGFVDLAIAVIVNAVTGFGGTRIDRGIAIITFLAGKITVAIIVDIAYGTITIEIEA